MKLEDIKIPIHLSAWGMRLMNLKTLKNDDEGNMAFIIPEPFLVELVQAALSGSLPKSGLKGDFGQNAQKKMKDDENEFNKIQSSVNEDIESNLPKELLDIHKSSRENILRSIFEWKQLGLKEVASRYGGSSAQANLANFLSRSDKDLRTMRRSTAIRLCKAMEIPKDLLLGFLELET